MARATRTGRRATRGTALLAGLAAVGLQPGAAGAQGARQDAQEAVVLDQLSVEGAGAAAAPRNGVVGPPPPAYPGGVVGSGSRLGLLGNRNLFDQPFSATSYTETLIRNQQARNVQDVVNNDPSVRTNVPAFSGILGFFVRGFPVFAQDMAFNGLFGVADNFNPAIEPIERVEVLRGPSTLLSGVPPFGNIGGLINLIPKRALDEPLTRVTLGYGSDAQVYKAIDVSRRFGEAKEWGIRFNGAFNNGRTPIDNQSVHFGVAALALDYRGERFRASLDLGHQELDFTSPLRNRSVAAGVRIPRAPDLTLNQHQPWEYRDSASQQLATRVEYDLTPDLTVYGAYGRSNFRQEYFGGVLTIFNARGDYRDPISYLPFHIVNDTAEAGLRGTLQTGPVKHSFGLAAVGFWQNLAQPPAQTVGATIVSNLYDPATVAPRSTIGLSNATPRTSSRINRSIAIADTLSILDDRVLLTLGGRWQGLDVNAYNPVTGFRTGTSESGAFSPGLGLVVKPVERLSLYANYIEGLTSPAPPVNAVNATAAFPAAVSRQTEVGAKYDFGTVGVGFAAFEIEQPFGFLNAANVFSVDGRQRNSGVELTVFGEPVPGIRLLGGVSLLDGVQVRAQDPRNLGRTAVGVPDAQVNLYAEYDLPPWLAPGLSLTGRVIYTAAQYYDLANAQKIPDWATLDLGLRYATTVHDRPLTLRANVLNVTGNNYWASTGRGVLSQGAPRTVLLSASVDF
ncbi:MULTISPECIES: TonB-dependent siderophore receptor [Methylobacterium]|uniref:Ferrichrome receptor FcuA n=3 Tax=Pseudomonadota TaxID=1224 RepID=A0ABQ4SXY8_9HYPH|nr:MULTISPECIES: TonB-dependent siderophore receptor [Methylobacterium]PIU04235.1 MAG: TonB-dependent siderophore receptor [Methylobacterium sp. CG09_land_8_20_14_0_10_71_15]PIU15187.1 MAG: TonB-dependent siderophore receptor [Methylobacterium sp. CG08_land_8_20_14_0_20_71_15]GBU19148.1 TonB dependent/Ligand-Gated channel TonB [Methylobacterium sp.]GJE06684.1 Ferrichrome receptor FcuA [Methylobacterium jeotgali]